MSTQASPKMVMDMIDLKRQQDRIRPSLDRRMSAVLAHGQYIMGPEVAELETALAGRTGVPHAIAVANGTDALQIAMMALGIGPGDEVVTTPFTFIATAETILLLGAKPVFVDIEPETYNLDPDRLDAAITPKTRAIIPVSLYGLCPDMDVVNSIAKARGVTVIEDAAQSLGSTYKGRQSGSLSQVACGSFFPSKPLGCYGDGGVIFTQDATLAAKIKQIRVHGQDRRYHHPTLGVNSRLDTLQAAILLAKLEVFNDEIEKRQKVAQRYDALFKGTSFTPQAVPQGYTSAFAQYTIRIPGGRRDEIQKKLTADGIPTAIHYPLPLHLQPVMGDLGQRKGTFPRAETAALEVLSLPMHPYLTEAEQARVAESLKKAWG